MLRKKSSNGEELSYKKSHLEITAPTIKPVRHPIVIAARIFHSVLVKSGRTDRVEKNPVNANKTVTGDGNRNESSKFRE
ncbi:hypothetical protein HY993_04330 [Candidatus Micrarchaeota archaeon]|nr:hypothetical protein [Candidatus Micrarchaeota archaeon]